MNIKERVKELHAENFLLSALIIADLFTLIEVTIVDPNAEVTVLTSLAIYTLIYMAISGLSLNIKKHKIKPLLKIAMYFILLFLFIFMRLTP